MRDQTGKLVRKITCSDGSPLSLGFVVGMEITTLTSFYQGDG